MRKLFSLIIIIFVFESCLEKETLKYKCEICEMSFEEKEWAEKCKDWCENHHSCNAAITQHAIK